MYNFVMEYVGYRQYLYARWVSVYNSQLRAGDSVANAERIAFETVTAMMQDDAAFRM